MSERMKDRALGWTVGLLTSIALSLGAWALSECSALGAEQARQKQEIKDVRELLSEVRADVRELLRIMQKGGK